MDACLHICLCLCVCERAQASEKERDCDCLTVSESVILTHLGFRASQARAAVTFKKSLGIAGTSGGHIQKEFGVMNETLWPRGTYDADT